MAAPTIKALNWKTAGEVLGGEASHFTPWLTENLELLGNALDIDGLTLVSSEHDIAGKRLDLLGAVGVEADGDTVGVAIENQYGTSDHSHLGQLITYVAGVSASYDRVLGVWLVDKVHAAHEAAIELLNRETTERLGFVLARPRFVPLGVEQFGVDFDIIVRPNEFIRSERKKAHSGNPDRAEFLERLIEGVTPAAKQAGFTTVSSSHGGYSFDISWGSSKWRVNVRAGNAEDGLRAMIYVDGLNTTEDNEALLAEFTAHSEVIEAALHDEHTFNPAAHTGSALAKKAAIAACTWPSFGYQSDVTEATARLVQFINGVATAVTAAGH